MIRLTALYPAKEGETFNYDYYFNNHHKLVVSRWKPEGMVSCEFDKGVSETANPKATTRSKRAGGRSTASKRRAAPGKRAPAKSKRAPAKKAPPKSRIARTKSTKAAATRRTSRKLASRTPRRGR
jgi:hypothetical protein